jgi:hypothetical protein
MQKNILEYTNPRILELLQIIFSLTIYNQINVRKVRFYH